jgi:glutamine synthetase type III
LKDITSEAETALTLISKLEAAVKKNDIAAIKEGTAKLRVPVDALERLVPADVWPLPSYAEMLFKF